MTNTRFNKIWNLLYKFGEVEFVNNQNRLSLVLVPSHYGNEISLRDETGTILVHYNKDRFKAILVD